MAIGTQKFRPYFSPPELLELISALREHPTPARMNLIHYLDTFAMKIERGTMQPQHVFKGTVKEQLVAAMGLGDIPPPSGLSDSQINEKWEASPNSCSPLELQKVLHYRFLNNLMTPEEEKMYMTNNGVNY